MLADVTHFTLEEGGEWHSWPFHKEVKPSNPELLCWKGGKPHMKWVDFSAGVAIRFHALRLSDGAVWDSINGFRRPEWRRPH